MVACNMSGYASIVHWLRSTLRLTRMQVHGVRLGAPSSTAAASSSISPWRATCRQAHAQTRRSRPDHFMSGQFEPLSETLITCDSC